MGSVVAAFTSPPCAAMAAPQYLITKLLSEVSKIIEELGEERVMISACDKIPPREMRTA